MPRSKVALVIAAAACFVFIGTWMWLETKSPTFGAFQPSAGDEFSLRRASELGVILGEYAEAYDVKLEALQTADSWSADPLADFVQVAVVNDPAPASVVLCRLVHHDGWKLEGQNN